MEFLPKRCHLPGRNTWTAGLAASTTWMQRPRCQHGILHLFPACNVCLMLAAAIWRAPPRSTLRMRSWSYGVDSRPT
eukprot:symbB.v1.2.033307.t1/scaffold4119.1/size46439/2